jgi:hypothetical protein
MLSKARFSIMQRSAPTTLDIVIVLQWIDILD